MDKSVCVIVHIIRMRARARVCVCRSGVRARIYERVKECEKGRFYFFLH